MSLLKNKKAYFACLLVLGLVACEGGKTVESEVDSQVGIDDSQLIRQAQSKYSGVGILTPYGCTGWFVTKKFFITNQHCVSDAKDLLPEGEILQHDNGYCSSMTISVSHYVDGQADSSSTYRCKKIHLATQSHDVAIVEIEVEANVEPLKIGSAATAGMEILVVGHPNGNAKTIVESEANAFCKLRDISFPDGKNARNAPEPRYGPKYEHSIEHNCDTLGGSSGSPVIDRQSGTVVGLHWDGWRSSAWPHADPAGTETANVLVPDATDPSVKVPFSFKHRQGNVAIKIQDIRSFVQGAVTQYPELAEAAALFN